MIKLVLILGLLASAGFSEDPAPAENKSKAKKITDQFSFKKQSAAKNIKAPSKNEDKKSGIKDKSASKGGQGMTAAEYRIYLITGILIVTPVILIITLLFLKLNMGSTAVNIVNVTGLILVIQATMFIVIASPSTEALTAAIGVLGAIIGYLFGANVHKPEKGEPESA